MLELIAVFSDFSLFKLASTLVRISQRKKCFTAFEGTGIPVPPLQSLINGHADAFFKQNQFECLGKWLKEYGDVFGFYLGDVPFVVIEDPDMINQIYAQDFNKFTGRGVMPSLINAQQQFLEVLGSMADAGTECEIGSRCERLTFDVISKAAFGIDTHVQKNTDNPLFKTAIECFPNIMKGFFYKLGRKLDAFFHFKGKILVSA
ncbi:hypothetical protein HPB48_003958 [Haemaphysalis longicornis]|uniref:Cytochrome P450 n=1 Tax=Haemaphysalis longicornis TaxID=44386 RepID=A0A9J6FQ70_HAELO|nr:hypothetical protein HPB48_003958 [Haemaphysalis longicornis]